MKRLLLTVTLVFSALASAQTVQPILQPRQFYADGSGNPCSGCSLYSFIAGTTTPQPTYTDSTGLIQATNPVILDAAGGASVWVNTSAYKFALLDASGTTLWTVDNVLAPIPGNLGPFLPLTGGFLSGPLFAPVIQANSASNINAPGATLQWNALGVSLGEADFINYKPVGAGGGFNWYNLTQGSAPGSPLAQLDFAGNFSIPGQFRVNGVQISAGNLSNGVSGTGAICLASGSACSSAGTNYQTVASNGAAQTQRPTLNFSPNFTITDSASPAQTTADLVNVGPGAGNCLNCSLSLDAKGRVTAYANGNPIPRVIAMVVTSGLCTTPGTSYGNCVDVASSTWPNGGFADTTYSVSCTLVGSWPKAIVQVFVAAKSAAGVTLGFANGTADGATTVSPSEVDCIGIHN